MDYTKDLETLCDVLQEQISDMTRKIKNGGMTNSDLDTMEKLTHSLKSAKGTIAMMDTGYSGRYPYYDRGNSYTRRDNRGGRYSRNDLAGKMRDLMDETDDERTRQEMQRLISKIENA